MTLTTEFCDDCGGDYKLQRKALTGRLHVTCECDERATAVQVAGRLPGEPHHESDRGPAESIPEYNQRIRERDNCEECGADVPDKDADHRYAQAAGILAGPFCSRDCYWDFFVEPEQESVEEEKDDT